LAHLLVISGWLLTPVLAWAASYVGLWAGALFCIRLSQPAAMVGMALGISALAGLSVLALWVRFMRRVPHLLSHHMASLEPPPSVATSD
jgi:hypothetical protein